MKHSYTLAALPVLVVGSIVAGSSQASARPIDPDAGYHDAVVVAEQPGPIKQVPVDDPLTEALQVSAGALGGAGLAVAGLWMYRRRHPLAVH